MCSIFFFVVFAEPTGLAMGYGFVFVLSYGAGRFVWGGTPTRFDPVFLARLSRFVFLQVGRFVLYSL
jgi:hypothetical protein